MEEAPVKYEILNLIPEDLFICGECELCHECDKLDRMGMKPEVCKSGGTRRVYRAYVKMKNTVNEEHKIMDIYLHKVDTLIEANTRHLKLNKFAREKGYTKPCKILLEINGTLWYGGLVF